MKRNAIRTAIAAFLASLGLLAGCASIGAAGRAGSTVDHQFQQDLIGGPN